MDYIISILPQMWLGTIETLKLFFITIVLSIPLGILLALARVSSLGSLRSAVGVYVWLLRGTPLMLQLLFVYYGLPFIPGIGIRMDDFQAAIFAFVLNYAAYFCEIFRGGILSVDKGQYEAAKVLGYSRLQSFFRVQLPQIFKNVMPSLTNEFVTLVKDTSIAKVIAVSLDNRTILHVAEKQVSGMVSLDPYIMALVFFLIFNGVVEQTCKWIERRMNYYR